MKIDSTALFVCLDDFCKLYDKAIKEQALPSPQSYRSRQGILSLSELMFIEVLYHFSPFKDFKRFYRFGLCVEYRSCFKSLPSYQRLVALKKKLFMPMSLLLHSLSGDKTGLYFADSTTLKVCRNKRIGSHKVFKGLAQRGKSTMGWFFGLKVHLIINHKGQLMAAKITPGNVDDRKGLTGLVKGLTGKCCADQGYVGEKTFKSLWEKGLQLITGIRRNMKNYLMPHIDKILLRKRFLIETVFGILKTEMNLEHSRHRSTTNAFVSIMAALIAYAYKTNKPKIKTNLLNP